MHTSSVFTKDELRAVPDHVFDPLRVKIDALVAQLPDISQLKNRQDKSTSLFIPVLIQPDIMLSFFKWYFDGLTPERLGNMNLQSVLADNAYQLKSPLKEYALKDSFKYKDAGQHALTAQEHKEAWDFLVEEAPEYVPGMALISNAIVTYFEAVKVNVVDKYLSAAIGVEEATAEQLATSFMVGHQHHANLFNSANEEQRLLAYQADKIEKAFSVARSNASLDSMVHEYLPLLIHRSSQSAEGITDSSLREGMKDGFVTASLFESVRQHVVPDANIYQSPTGVQIASNIMTAPHVSRCPFKKTVGFLMNAGVSVQEGRGFVIEPNAGPAAMLMFTTQLYRGYRQEGHEKQVDVNGPV